MDIGSIEDFLTLCEELSFSQAAARRNMTQPAFSRRVRAFEDWVGTPLFTRTSRHVALTPAGQAFRPRAAAMIRDLRRARDEALEVAGKTVSPLTIAATQALSFTFVPGWLLQQVAAPSLGPVNLISGNFEECEALLFRGETPFLICHSGQSLPPRLIGRHFRSLRIGTDRLIPLSRPDTDGQPLWRLDAGSDHPVPYLAYGPQSGLGRILAAHWQAQGSRPRVQTKVQSPLAATLHQMAMAGQGIAWVPQSLAQADIDAGRLVRAGDAGDEIEVAILLIRPASRLGRDAERFWDRVAAGADIYADLA